ncbi:hypothetical protein HDE_05697 [Halotydeus destructor]|nr:hypothetical protein HDE_05697 [Halotydeus destructor]
MYVYLTATGTTTLLRHTKTCAGRPETPSVAAFFKATCPLNVRKKLATAAAIWCAIDLRAFQAVEGKGFQRLTQEYINIGSVYGRVKAVNVTPCANTVNKHLDTL